MSRKTIKFFGTVPFISPKIEDEPKVQTRMKGGENAIKGQFRGVYALK